MTMFKRIASLLSAIILAPALQALTVSNVTVVNITPSSFSVLWRSSETSSPSLSVFANAAGTTSLAGELAIEVYPLNTGVLTASGDFDKRALDRDLQNKTKNFGHALIKVSGCQPNTTYYFRVRSTNANESVVWPASGQLPSVTTARESTFAPHSKQLLLDIPGTNVTGRLITLGNTNTSAKIAAVVGDGAAPNQAFFNVSDLVSLMGGSNQIPVDPFPVTVDLLGPNHERGLDARYTLVFDPEFTVGQVDIRTFGREFLLVSAGQLILEQGEAGSIPLSIASSEGVTDITFGLRIPTNRLSNLTLQTIAPEIQSAQFVPVDSSSYGIEITTRAGTAIQGTQEVARLHFVAVSNAPPSFNIIQPFEIEGSRIEGTPYARGLARNGRVIVVGDQPLLEALLLPADVRDVMVYCRPGATINLETSLISSGGWTNHATRSMITLSERFTNLRTNESTRFYRAINTTPRAGASAVIEDHPRLNYSIQD